MRWTPGGVSGDIEDRRGAGGFGGFGGMRLGLGGTLVLLVLSVIFRTDLFQFVGGAPGVSAPAQAPAEQSAAEERQVQFVSFVLDDAQRTWTRIMPEYRRAKLVLFRDITQSACGTAQSATGPFYCPGDEKVYIDLGFFDDLRSRFGAPGEFAQAYVLAHEIGHHVQNVMGVERQVRRLQRGNPGAANQLSVAMELQADCLAGVWGHSTAERNLLESADVEAGMRAAAAVGDDRIQRMSGREISPESFTHGSSAQRMQWFRRGLETGSVEACNAFRQ